jgi:N-acetyl-alpha-D-glucosaminyl L-malate synthase BshA
MSLRVGLLCHDSVGGSARVAVELAAGLAHRGHEIHLFSRRAPLGVSAPPDGVTLHTLDGSSVHGAAASKLDTNWSGAEIEALAGRVANLSRSVGLDVIHFHYAVPFASVAERAGRMLAASRPALVGTLHGTDVSVLGWRPDTRRQLSAILPGLDALTTVSQNHAELATRTLRLAEEPRVIPNFVDLARFQPDPSARANGRRPRIVHISNFRRVKQPLAMARIFCEVRRKQDAELWLVGDGGGMRSVRELLGRGGFAGEIERFGLRLDVEHVLPHADVLLVTSRAESFCLAALEAAACGLPVVAPRVGGLPETVVDGHTGVLYEPGDEAGAARAVVALLANREPRRRMGAAAVWHAQQFSAAAVVPRYEQLYHDVLGTTEVEEEELCESSAA